jgi:hypothetical protein
MKMKDIIATVLVIAASAGILVSGETETGYKGEYTMKCKNPASGEEYNATVKIYGPMSGAYIVECKQGDEFFSGNGIEFDGMFFAYDVASGYPLEVYTKEGSELYSLEVTEDGDVVKKATKGECPLELAPIDSLLAGIYLAQGTADDKSFSFSDTVILEPSGGMWEASFIEHTQGYETQPGSVERAGSGFQSGEMLVLSYYDDGREFLKVYKTAGDSIKGRFIVYYWDAAENGAVVTTGSEKLTRILDSGEER